MMKHCIRVLAMIILSFGWSCSTKISPLEHALFQTKENRGEFEKVLHHYSQSPHDSLKLKAAVFLIENMPQHFYYRHNVEYFPIMDSLNKNNVGINEERIFTYVNGQQIWY